MRLPPHDEASRLSRWRFLYSAEQFARRNEINPSRYDLAVIKFLFLLFYFLCWKLFGSLLRFLRRRSLVAWRKVKVTVFLLAFFMLVRRESLQMFSFVSPHKLINILFLWLSLSLPLAGDNNIKNYCLTFMCHLANISPFFLLLLATEKAFLLFHIVYPL